MRPRGAVLGAAVGALLAAAPAAPAAAQDEVVRLAVEAPAAVPLGAPVPVAFTVTADPGALDDAGPFRVRAKLAPRCGASFARTDGTPIADAEPVVTSDPSGGFLARAGGSVTPPAPGTYLVCAFFEQEGDDRLYAASLDTEVTVSPAGPRTLGLTCAFTRPAARRVRATCAATGTAAQDPGVVLMALSRGGKDVAVAGAWLSGGGVVVPFAPGRRLPAGTYRWRALVFTSAANYLIPRTDTTGL